MNVHLKNIVDELPSQVTRKGLSDDDSENLGVLAVGSERVAVTN